MNLRSFIDRLGLESTDEHERLTDDQLRDLFCQSAFELAADLITLAVQLEIRDEALQRTWLKLNSPSSFSQFKAKEKLELSRFVGQIVKSIKADLYRDSNKRDAKRVRVRLDILDMTWDGLKAKMDDKDLAKKIDDFSKGNAVSNRTELKKKIAESLGAPSLFDDRYNGQETIESTAGDIEQPIHSLIEDELVARLAEILQTMPHSDVGCYYFCQATMEHTANALNISIEDVDRRRKIFRRTLGRSSIGELLQDDTEMFISAWHIARLRTCPNNVVVESLNEVCGLLANDED